MNKLKKGVVVYDVIVSCFRNDSYSNKRNVYEQSKGRTRYKDDACRYVNDNFICTVLI